MAVHPVPSTEGLWFADFGKAAFGAVEFQATATGDNQTVMVHLGEVFQKTDRALTRTRAAPGATGSCNDP